MQSFSDLNSYNSSSTLSYDDSRIANVTFNLVTAINQTKVVNEGETFTASVGIEITDVARYDISLPTYTIDVSSVAGFTVNWPSVPSGCTVTNPFAGVYKISGVNSPAIWDIIKSPNIIQPPGLPNSYYGTFTYTSTINYSNGISGPQTKSWTTVVTVLDVTALTNPTEFTYQTNTSTSITGYPQVIDLPDYDDLSTVWTVIMEPNNGSSITSISTTVSHSGFGAGFTFNGTTKRTTISGLRTVVNDYLSHLVIASNTSTIDFTMNYLLSNNQDTSTDTKSQVFKNADTNYLGNVPSPTIYYTEDAVSVAVTGGPSITDTSTDGTGPYTLVVTPSTTTAYSTMASAGTGGTSSFNSGTKVLTISGTRTQVNSHLAAITFVPTSDFASPFYLTYYLSRSGATATKIQNLLCGSNDTEITNMNVIRNYVTNNYNLIFATATPSITDFDTTGTDSYTITLSCDFGDWGTDDVTLANPYTFTGTRAEVNALFPTIKFYPDADYSSNGTFTYIQSKNSVEQVNQSVALNNSAGSSYSNSRNIWFFATQTWTPTLLDSKYSKIDYALLIGGGASGNRYGGGGGGGGITYATSDINFTPNTTYTITVGAGGADHTNSQGGSYGNNGSATSAFGLTAGGGSSGFQSGGGTSGWASGSPGLNDPGSGPGYTGGNGKTVSGTIVGGGGGGGHNNTNGFAGGSVFPHNAGTYTGGRGGYGADYYAPSDHTGSEFLTLFQEAGTKLERTANPDLAVSLRTNSILAGGGGGGGTSTGGASTGGGYGATASAAATARSNGYEWNNWGGGGAGGWAASNFPGLSGEDGIVVIRIVGR